MCTHSPAIDPALVAAFIQADRPAFQSAERAPDGSTQLRTIEPAHESSFGATQCCTKRSTVSSALDSTYVAAEFATIRAAKRSAIRATNFVPIDTAVCTTIHAAER